MMDLRDPIAPEKAIASSRLSELIRRLGVHAQAADIHRCFQLICGKSLQPDAGASSLNSDGTPLQFALSLGAGLPPALEFVGEAFEADMSYAARRAFGLTAMSRVAFTLGLQSQFECLQPYLDRFAVSEPPGDGEDPAGAFWIGTSFEPSGARSMVIYANARHGEGSARWRRLAAFLRSVNGAPDWERVFAIAQAARLSPLGAGVRISLDRHLHARVYFGAYGVRPCDYREMFRDARVGDSFDRSLADFFNETLGSEAAFPTGSAVFSLGASGGEWSPKLELCAHCAWTSDRLVRERCSAWLLRMGLDAAIYRETSSLFLDGATASGAVRAHAFVGVGSKRDRSYASIYLNPGGLDPLRQ